MKQIWKENTKIIFFTSTRDRLKPILDPSLSLDKKHGARSCNDEKEILYLGGWRSLFSRPVDSFHGTVIPGDERFPWVNKSQSRTLSTEITFHSAPPRVFPLLALFLLARFHKAIPGLVSTPLPSWQRFSRVDISRRSWINLLLLSFLPLLFLFSLFSISGFCLSHARNWRAVKYAGYLSS